MHFRHAVLRPEGEGPFPALIALHGHGAHALDLIGLSQFLPEQLLWLCPQAEYTVQAGFHGFTWFHFERDDPQREQEVAQVVARLRAFIDAAVERYAIDPQRMALLGFSQGGMLGYQLALSEPTRFAGLAALSTMLSAPFADALPPAEGLKQLPVLVQHGTHDTMIGVDRARESRDRLQAMGVDVEYHEYEMAHQVGNDSARDLAVWLTSVLKLGAV